MPGINVEIKQDIKKHIRKFITPRGEVVDGGAENLGNNMGGVGRPDKFPERSK